MEHITVISSITQIEVEKTMSSLDLVALINRVRKIEFEEGKSKNLIKLRHDHFMDKVPLVLGEALAPKFLGTNKYQNGKGGWSERKIYKLPEREAWLMAMSYSYTLQAYIYDALQEAFKCNHDIRSILNNFTNLEKRVTLNGSEWGKMGVDQKKNKSTLNSLEKIINDFAQLKLFSNDKGVA